MENLGFTGNVHIYIYNIRTYIYRDIDWGICFFASDSDPNCETKLVSAVLMN